MHRNILAAALRVLTSSYDGKKAAAEDVALIRKHALPEEMSYELDDMARSVVHRVLVERRLA